MARSVAEARGNGQRARGVVGIDRGGGVGRVGEGETRRDEFLAGLVGHDDVTGVMLWSGPVDVLVLVGRYGEFVRLVSS